MVEALVKALLATELFQDAIKNFAQQIDYAIKQSFIDGVFNPEIFREISRPAVEAWGAFWTNTGLKALEVIWGEAKDLGSYLSSLASYANSIATTASSNTQAITGETTNQLNNCSLACRRTSRSMSRVTTSTKKMKEEIKEVNNLLSAFSSLLGNAFSTATWEMALATLEKNLYQGLYQTVVKSITNGLLAASAFKTPIETLGKAINKAANEAFKDGVFNPDKFKSIFDPALKTFKDWFENTGTKAVKTVYDYLNDLFGTLMGSRYSLNYATVDIAGVISVPSYQKGGYVSETGLAYLHKGEYVNPSGKENITVNQTLISPKPLNERESRRQMERGMRIMSLELGLA